VNFDFQRGSCGIASTPRLAIALLISADAANFAAIMIAALFQASINHSITRSLISVG